MKTTIDIANDLAVRARELAAKRGTTLRAVVEEGLRMALGRDLVEPLRSVDRSLVFDLGSAGGSDIVSEKDRMIAEAMSAEKRRH